MRVPATTLLLLPRHAKVLRLLSEFRGLSVVVEGVETTEQDKLVRDLGCDLAQGFLYTRPMPADQMPI